MTAATSRSAALSTMPSATTRQPSFTTGKKIISIMSLWGGGGGRGIEGKERRRILEFLNFDA